MVARSVLSIVLLAAVFAAPAARAVVLVPAGFTDEQVLTGLHDPTSFAFLPDGRVLALEQFSGDIRLMVDDGAGPKTLTTVTDLVAAAERGALAIAVDPRWPSPPYVYVYYTASDGHRIVRYTAFGDFTTPSRDLALGVRRVILDRLADSNFNHNGGALRFGPDGMLYLSLGDDAKGCPAQDSSSLQGCILRMDVRNVPAGPGAAPPRATLAPPDNPYAGSADPDARLVYAHGFRNPFRFDIDPVDGRLFVADVGEDTWEEMDVIGAADNGGWPYREGPAHYDYPGCADPGGGAYAEPIDSYGHDEGLVIISAGVYRRQVHSRKWPAAWDGNVFYADFFTGFVRMLAPQGNGWVRMAAAGQPDAEHWATGLADPVEFRRGPDGELWYLSMSEGAIHRIAATSVADAGPPPPPPGHVALGVAPNPASGTVRLACDLPRAGPLRLTIHDLSGRRVAVVAEGWFDAGHRVMVWNGLDARGRRVPAGLYLAVLDVDGERVARRLVRGR